MDNNKCLCYLIYPEEDYVLCDLSNLNEEQILDLSLTYYSKISLPRTCDINNCPYIAVLRSDIKKGKTRVCDIIVNEEEELNDQED